MSKKVVRKLTSPLELLGLPSLPDLPEPGKIKEIVEKLNETLGEVKEVPETVLNHFAGADENFRNAQKAFGGVRIKKK